jgi:gamma-glutamyltranspeptidase/glutathione hydrolase
MNNQSTKDKDARSANAMAATSHPLATEEALKILKMGGNAVDASIAASIVLSVVEPNATSIGGDCFAIVKMNNKDAVSFNGSGLAPEKLSYDFFKEKNIDKIGLTSPHSVTIPGAVHAWETIHKEFGKLDFEQLFLGAIEIAKNGHKISKVVSNAWHNSLNKINGNENSKKIFLKEGRTYQENELMKNIPLGKTLEAISKKGSKEFYEGETAKDIIESLNELGGVHTFEDFSKQNTIRSETIKSSYKGDFIHQCPPNGPGVTVLIMMKLLEKLNIQNYKFNSTERFHLEAEVTKQAYKVKETSLGDPNFVNFDLDEILSDENIDDILIKLISILAVMLVT